MMVHYSLDRQILKQYQYFGLIVCYYFNEILQVFFQQYIQYIRLSKSLYLHYICILEDPKYILYFNNCIGVIDRTYISIYMLASEKIFY